MNHHAFVKSSALAVGLTLIAGCSMFGGSETSSQDSASVAEQKGATVGIGNHDADTGRRAEHLAQATAPDQNIVYFDFDQATVRMEARIALRAHAEYVNQSGIRKLDVAGHADERGTREYNMALGEERAKAVRDILVAYGVSPDRIRTVSYGEEKPAVSVASERSWALNRRAELSYH